MRQVGRRIGGALGAFARRLAMQALISSIVMAGIGTASRDDFALPRAVLAGLGFGVASGPALAVGSDGQSGKSARLAYAPASRGVLPAMVEAGHSSAAATASKPAVLTARADAGAKADQAVLLFTQCAPACESRDPLIVAAALPMAPPPPREIDAAPTTSPVSEVAPAPAGDENELPPPAALTARADEEETLVETTVALPGRALGAAAQLVGWGG